MSAEESYIRKHSPPYQLSVHLTEGTERKKNAQTNIQERSVQVHLSWPILYLPEKNVQTIILKSCNILLHIFRAMTVIELTDAEAGLRNSENAELPITYPDYVCISV